MHTLAQKKNQPQKKSSANLTRSNTRAAAARHEAHPLLRLQRTIGNQAVLRLLRTRADGPAPTTIQPKLAVNDPGDIYEQEADHVSEQVMRMPEPTLQRTCDGSNECQMGETGQEDQHLQTKLISSSGAGQTSAPPIVQQVLGSPGQPLNASARAFFEPRFGHDFSRVRVHTDARAADSAQAVNAVAYTVGNDIAFGAGRYAPETMPGRKLMAHELTHVMQQTSNGNRAETPALQRRVVSVAGMATDVEFTVGKEISVELARKAKAAAAGGITPDELGKLRETALGDGTINDDERMFLAGLLDAGNAAAVAAMNVTRGSTITFSVHTIRPNIAQVKDVGRTMPADVASHAAAAAAAHAQTDIIGLGKHLLAAEAAAESAIIRMTGAFAPKARAVLALAKPQGILAVTLMRAMIAAASDSTPGDLALAGAVYVVAHEVGSPLADDILNGHIKVDQLPGAAKGNDFAHYSAFGEGEKGDTIYVYSDLNVNNLAHRRAIIHELDHAHQDKLTTAGRFRASKKDDEEIRAYRAGSKYALERLAVLQDRVNTTSGTANTAALRALGNAVAELAAQAHPIHIIALALEARSNLARFEMLVVSVNDKVTRARKFSTGRLTQLHRGPIGAVEAELRDLIRRELGVIQPGGTIDFTKNVGRFDALSGESVLDTVDLPRQ